jgi:hypothetical protein
LISDEMLDALLPQATYAELAGVLRQRLGGLADGVIIPPPTDRADDELMAGVVAALRRDE